MAGEELVKHDRGCSKKRHDPGPTCRVQIVAPEWASRASKCPALVVARSRSTVPVSVLTRDRAVTAPSIVDGTSTLNSKVSLLTLRADMRCSSVLLPLCLGPPLNCGQS